jgi:hypothetical protein
MLHLGQSHLDAQIQVEGELSEVEREGGILDAASLKVEITAFKKEVLATLGDEFVVVDQPHQLLPFAIAW